MSDNDPKPRQEPEQEPQQQPPQDRPTTERPFIKESDPGGRRRDDLPDPRREEQRNHPDK